MTAITKCFPGKGSGGKGDRRPSRQEVALCRPYLEAQLALVRPETILLVGSLAIERWFPHAPLVDLIGQQFVSDGVLLIPLPHPSGASRWLNEPSHQELLRDALRHVRVVWEHRRAVEPVCAAT